jgi:hypothetical protein
MVGEAGRGRQYGLDMRVSGGDMGWHTHDAATQLRKVEDLALAHQDSRPRLVDLATCTARDEIAAEDL